MRKSSLAGFAEVRRFAKSVSDNESNEKGAITRPLFQVRRKFTSEAALSNGACYTLEVVLDADEIHRNPIPDFDKSVGSTPIIVPDHA